MLDAAPCERQMQYGTGMREGISVFCLQGKKACNESVDEMIMKNLR